MSERLLSTWKILLLLLGVLVVVLPPSVRVSCQVHAPNPQPQPLAEPCDMVLLRQERVHVEVTAFDVALTTGLLALPGALWLLWQTLLPHRVILHEFLLAPDSPPPRRRAV
jgi:hypothetical protein